MLSIFYTLLTKNIDTSVIFSYEMLCLQWSVQRTSDVYPNWYTKLMSFLTWSINFTLWLDWSGLILLITMSNKWHLMLFVSRLIFIKSEMA